MALTASAVRVGVTGKIYVAPLLTAVPTSAIAALNTAFYDVGYATEDGVTFQPTIEGTDLKAWQGGVIVRHVQTSVIYTLAFTMMETNEKTLEVYFNNFTHGAAGASGVSDLNANQPYRGAWVADVVDGTELIRIVIPDGQITDRGAISIVNGDAITYPITVQGYPDAANSAGKVYTETIAAS